MNDGNKVILLNKQNLTLSKTISMNSNNLGLFKISDNNFAIFESQNKTLNFVNQFKSFILDIGISDKKFYEQCIREIIYN